jgi:CBS domain-containing protein
MLTDGDVTVRVVAAELDPAVTKVEEVCTRELVAVDALTEVGEVERLMREHLIYRLPIVDEHGQAQGILSLEDLPASGYVDDHELRDVVRSIARAYRQRSKAIP